MIKVYGSGDDLIVVEGDITAEFFAVEETHYLALSDGSVIKFIFEDAVWKIIVIDGNMEYSIEPADDGDITSEALVSDDPFDWVMFGNNFERAR
jgi:hypothetical protein